MNKKRMGISIIFITWAIISLLLGSFIVNYTHVDRINCWNRDGIYEWYNFGCTFPYFMYLGFGIFIGGWMLLSLIKQWWSWVNEKER